MPTAIGLGKRAKRSSMSCPSAESRSASAAELSVRNSSISAPAMKFSALPEKNATAFTLGSPASAAKQARNSSFTAREMTLTGWLLRSSTTVAIPSAMPQVTAGAVRAGGAIVAISAAPAPWRIPCRPARTRRSSRTARDAAVAAIEHGLELRHLLERRVGSDAVVLPHDGLAGTGGQPRHDFRRQPAVGSTLRGELVAAQRPPVLRLARDVIFLRHLLRGLTHRLTGRWLRDCGRHWHEILRADLGKGLDAATEGLGLARFHEDIGKPAGGENRDIRQCFGTTRDYDVRVAERDLILPGANRLICRGAGPVQ